MFCRFTEVNLGLKIKKMKDSDINLITRSSDLSVFEYLVKVRKERTQSKTPWLQKTTLLLCTFETDIILK